ncbi:MAG: tRNA pseudouridine(55) synthase TruB [Firmicutes bacterium]|nr:tRNA pseudouridine(55) synthase TruB [Bacillota bacterium]
MDENISGVVNIYKEKGYTSHDIVNIVRRAFNRAKTGHTGTLDPQAEGVLPVCVGKATKLCDTIAADVKEYRAQLTLGVTTDTEDHTGEILESRAVECTREQAEAAVLSFIGEYEQIPPMYSAVKHEGRKLYDLARSGVEVERTPRLINIYDITDIDFSLFDEHKLAFTVRCSKGTYIRTLCKDIGEKLGCGAHMSGLVRTRSGRFLIEDSITLDKFRALMEAGETEKVLIPIEKVVGECKSSKVAPKANNYLYNGNKINVGFLFNKANIENGDRVLLYDKDGKIAGLYKVRDGFAYPDIMLC